MNHSHICKLYDVGPNYLLIESVDGKPLQGRWDWSRRCSTPSRSRKGWTRAHREGITHRDLKPANILVAKSGTKLLDFGLAKLSKQREAAAGAETRTMALTDENAILGTLQYMAPEQLEGKEADARSDLFAFGAVRYEIVTGKRAFEGASKASAASAETVRFSIYPPEKNTLSGAFNTTLSVPQFALSPDGRAIVFAAGVQPRVFGGPADAAACREQDGGELPAVR